MVPRQTARPDVFTASTMKNWISRPATKPCLPDDDEEGVVHADAQPDHERRLVQILGMERTWLTNPMMPTTMPSANRAEMIDRRRRTRIRGSGGARRGRGAPRPGAKKDGYFPGSARAPVTATLVRRRGACHDVDESLASAFDISFSVFELDLEEADRLVHVDMVVSTRSPEASTGSEQRSPRQGLDLVRHALMRCPTADRPGSCRRRCRRPPARCHQSADAANLRRSMASKDSVSGNSKFSKVRATDSR